MHINIKARGIDLSSSLRDYVDTKIGSLVKFIAPKVSSEVVVNVEIGKTTTHHKSGEIFKAEANILRPGGKVVREEVLNEDLYAAIDELKSTLAHSLGSAGHKKSALFRRGGRAIKNMVRGFIK